MKRNNYNSKYWVRLIMIKEINISKNVRAGIDIISRKGSLPSHHIVTLKSPIHKIKNTPILKEKNLNQTCKSITLRR